MVNMTSGMHHARVRPSKKNDFALNIADKLQLIPSLGLQRIFFYIGHPCYGQLTPIKTKYPLTSITLPYQV